jgi:hypothetical protein
MRVPLLLRAGRGGGGGGLSVAALTTTASPAAAPAAPPAAAAAAAGSLFIWGKIDDARMGMKVDASGHALTQVAMGPEISPTAHPHLHHVVQAVCKGAKTLALTRDGAVYSWGTCDNQSLGHGPSARVVHRPKRVEALDGIKIVQVRGDAAGRAGVRATCAHVVAAQMTRRGWG